MKKLFLFTLIALLFPFVVLAQSTIEETKIKSIQWESGATYIAQIDSIEFELDRVAVKGLNPNWIHSITVYKDEIPEKYKEYAECGVFVIKPKEASKGNFMSLKFEVAARQKKSGEK